MKHKVEKLMATQSIVKQSKPSQWRQASSSEHGARKEGRKEGRSPFIIRIEKLSIHRTPSTPSPADNTSKVSGYTSPAMAMVRSQPQPS